MSSKVGAFIVLVAVFGVASFAFIATTKTNFKPSDKLVINIDSDSNSKPQTQTLTIPESKPTASSVIYSANVSYNVPENNETLALTISVSNGIVSDVNIVQSKTGRKSANYQTNFEKSYKQFVIGKQLKDINLSRVGGASITTNAFMEAIKAVQKQAL